MLSRGLCAGALLPDFSCKRVSCLVISREGTVCVRLYFVGPRPNLRVDCIWVSCLASWCPMERDASWSICREPSELTRDPGSGHGSHDGVMPRRPYRALLVIHLMFGFCVPLRAAMCAVRPCV